MNAYICFFCLQDTAAKLWIPMGKLVHQCGQAAVSGIENLERSRGKVTASTFKACAGLMTPKAVESAVACLNQANVTVPIFKGDLSRILKEQWVDFHWHHPENEYLHKSKSMQAQNQ